MNKKEEIISLILSCSGKNDKEKLALISAKIQELIPKIKSLHFYHKKQLLFSTGKQSEKGENYKLKNINIDLFVVGDLESEDKELLQKIFLPVTGAIIPKQKRKFPKKLLLLLSLIFFIRINDSITTTFIVKEDENFLHYIYAPFSASIEKIYQKNETPIKVGDKVLKLDNSKYKLRLYEIEKEIEKISSSQSILGNNYEQSQFDSLELKKKIFLEEKKLVEDWIKKSSIKASGDGILVFEKSPKILLNSVIDAGKVIAKIFNPSKSKIEVLIPQQWAYIIRQASKIKIRSIDNFFSNEVEIIDKKITPIFKESGIFFSIIVKPKEILSLPIESTGEAIVEGKSEFLGYKIIKILLLWIKQS